jgi:hypothetical protein
MKTNLTPLLIAALGLAACSGQSSNAPQAPAPAPAAQAPAPSVPVATPAAPPVDPARAEMVKRAEALTQEQIGEARDLQSLSRLAQLYGEIKDTQRLTWSLEQLTRLLPNAGDLRLKLAMTYADTGDKSRTYDLLLKMVNQGYAYDLSKEPAFEKVGGTKVWDYILESLARNAKPFGEGKVAFELPKGDTLFESIAWDPKRKQFLVGSVREGKIHLADNSGKLSDFISPDASNGLMAVFGMSVDSAHDRLYVVSNGVPHFQGFNADMVGKAGLFEFALSSGKLLKKYILPQDNVTHVLSSIAVDGKGAVYVADGVNQQIYRLDGGALQLMLGNPALSGIRGMTVTPDGKTMYFSDAALGIFGVDLTKRAPFNLAFNTQKLVLGGIDALYWYNGTLTAIQGGMEPERVLRLKLSDDGHTIVSALPLDAAQPAFDALGQGAVVGDDLYFIANSQKDLYSNLGVLTDPSALEPVSIFRSNLHFAWDQKGTDTSPVKAPAVQTHTQEQLEELRRAPPKGVVSPLPAAKPAEPPAKQDH